MNLFDLPSKYHIVYLADIVQKDVTKDYHNEKYNSNKIRRPMVPDVTSYYASKKKELLFITYN